MKTSQLPETESSDQVNELLLFIDEMNEIFLLVDEERHVVTASRMAREVFGFTETPGSVVMIDDFFPRVYLDAIFSRMMDEDAKRRSLTFPVKNAAGGEIVLETRFNWISLGGKMRLALSCRDINSYIGTITDLSEREDLYRTIFHESPLGFIHVNSDGIITDCNNAFLSIFGLLRVDAIGVCLAEQNGLCLYPRFKRAAMNAVVGSESKHEAQFRTADGERQGWVSVSFTPVRSDNQTFLGAVGIVEDVTESKQTEERVSFVSTHDVLTGLFNRRACEEALVAFDKPDCLPLGIIYADLNSLKLANDAFGHQEGDNLLKLTSSMLQKATTENDMAYRWGGDEFIILLRNTDAASVVERVDRIHRMCEAWEGDAFVRPSMALGYAVKVFSDQDIDEVMKEAEDDMYANKLRLGKPTRLRILGALEAGAHKLMDCAVGIRSKRMILWGEWAIQNLRIEGDPDTLRLLCRYHDIGMLATADELEIVRHAPDRERVASPMQHMATGYRIARSIAEIAPAAEYILAHHEWWDGMGYPNQLKGTNIPYISRLVSIFDAVESMVSLNHHAPAWGEVLHSIESCAGRQFDPALTGEIAAHLRGGPPDFIDNVEGNAQ